MEAARAWFVLFFPAAALLRRAWWLRGLHPGYAHVAACRAESDGATCLIDHRGGRLLAERMPMPVGAFLRGLLEQPAPAWILAVPPAALPGDAADRARLRGPMSCVEAVKAALALRAPWVVTPRQLARHLRRRLGARPVLPLTA